MHKSGSEPRVNWTEVRSKVRPVGFGLPLNVLNAFKLLLQTPNADLVLQKICGVQMGSYGSGIDVIITCVRWRRESRHMLWRRFLVTLSVL